MTKHILTVLMMGLAVCLTGCTDQAADEGGGEGAATESSGMRMNKEGAEAAMAESAEAAAEPAAAAAEETGDAAAMTMTKLEGADVEAGCAKCAYGLADECMLGMKVGDKTYIVEGTGIISDDVGLCQGHRPANVTGEARDETHFVASAWKFTDE